MLSVPTGPSACWQLPTELAPAGGASIIPEPVGAVALGLAASETPGGWAQPACGKHETPAGVLEGWARWAQAPGGGVWPSDPQLTHAPSRALASPSEWSTPPGWKHSSISGGHHKAGCLGPSPGLAWQRAALQRPQALPGP